MKYNDPKWSVMMVCALLVLPAILSGMPPHQGVKITRSEEWSQLGVDAPMNPVRDAGKRDIVNRPGEVTPLVTGTKQFPVVTIDYSDYTSTYTTTNFQNMLFGTWTSGSARDYFHEVSYNQFHMTGTVAGWYRAANTRSYYGYNNGFTRAAMLAKEAAIAADPTTNYALYDNDGDGYVDVFTCVHAGYGTEESGNGADIWSHKWDFASAGIGAYTTNDPDPINGGYIRINLYTMDPERSDYSNNGTMVAIGVFCHEWGHSLGLPDLYNTGSNPGEGLGNWSVMAGGSWGGDGNSPYYPVHPDAWCKLELGWLNPAAVRLRNRYSLPQVENNARGYWMISNARTFKEYFLVENRQKTLFDVNLYNSGLLIYHIDDSVINRRRGTNEVNANAAGWKYGVALEEADGDTALKSGGNRGSANDPWPGGLGRTTFDNTTTPNSKTNYPTAGPLASNCLAKNIPASANPMLCSLASGVQGAFTGGPDAGGYRWIDSDTTGGPTYAWNDITGTGTLLGNGDEARWSVSLPYTFNYYGTGYTTMWVSTNGWLSFGGDPGTNASSNTAIPNAAAPNAAVYAFWDNLNFVSSDSGYIYYRNLGTSPNCSTIVMWKNGRIVGGSTYNQVTFEAVLYQGGKIHLRYRDCGATDTVYTWGRSASVGVENAAGGVGLQYLYAGAPKGNLLQNVREIEFSPLSGPDVGVTLITAPTATIDSGTAVTPACSVYNYGTSAQSYNVRMKIGSAYNQTAAVVGHGVGSKLYVTFPTWTALPRGSLAVTCSTELSGDIANGNDKATGTVTVQVRDAQTVSIIAPTGTVNQGSVVAPQASVRNNGSISLTFNVRFDISDGYNNTQSVTLAAGATATVTFANWTANTAGNLTTKCSTQVTGDVTPSNDKVTGSVLVQTLDAQTVSIIAPTGTVNQGAVVAPQASVRNNGNTSQTFNVRFDISDGYNGTQSVTLGAGATTTVTFANWTANTAGNLTTKCSTQLTGDMTPGNDKVTGSVLVQTLDAQTVSIIAPIGTVNQGAVIAPQASVRNNGNTSQTFSVRFTVAGGYADSATVTLGAGATQTVTFTNWTAATLGSLATSCSTRLSGDMTPSNNRVTGTVLVQNLDAQTVSIIAPTGTVNQGTVTTPQASIRNNGNSTQTIPIKFTIGAGYADSTTVTLAAGATQTVSFTNWTASPAGTLATKCSTRLTGDMTPGNNALTGSVTVQGLDAQTVSIIAPTGTVDQGSVVAPQASVRNNGNTSQTFSIKFTIQGGYADSATVTLGAGSTQTVTFTNWTAGTSGTLATSCSTRLSGDMTPSNDKVTGSVLVQTLDAQTVSIIAPTGTVNQGVVIAPQASVRNNGNTSQTFSVRFIVAGGYADSATVTLGAGATQTVTFTNWAAATLGSLATSCSTRLSGDMTPGNNRVAGTVFVQSLDAQTVSIIAPTGTVNQGSVAAPQASIRNNGNTSQTFSVKFTIQGGYADSATVTLAAGATQAVTFANWTASPAGTLATKCSTRLTGDMTPANNAVTGSVLVQTLDAQAVAVIAPTGTVNQGSVVAPQASVRNNGNTAQTFSVKFTIQGGYADSATVTLAAGATQTVTFANWTATTIGSLATGCSTRLTGDMTPGNNRVTGTVFVQNLDAQTVSISAPTGTVSQGSIIAPQGSVRNNGNTSQTFSVKFTIQGGYADSATVTLAAGATQAITFGNWTAAPTGTLATRCSTRLTGDMTPANNVQTGSVIVQAATLDAQTVSIDAPTGTVNQGAVVAPQATVRNNSTTSQTFYVKFNIAPVYADSQSVTLASGASQSVTFANWTAATPGALALRCSTKLAGDVTPANDRVVDSIFVALTDIGAVAIVAPIGTIPPGAVVPRAMVHNYGNVRPPCTVFFRISGASGYLDSLVLAGGLPYADTALAFTSWDAVSGGYAAKCSTYLAADQLGANNIVTGAFTVGQPDVGVQAITGPTGTLDSSAAIAPAAVVRNYGIAAATFSTFFGFADSLGATVYTDSQIVFSLNPGSTAGVTFNVWSRPHALGSYTTRCSTALIGDGNPANDVAVGSFRIVAQPAITGWIRKGDMPVGSKGKAVKDGGALGYSSPLVYAFKGNNRYEFYAYDPVGNSWAVRESIPAIGRSGKKKAVKKGASLAGAPGAVYAAKGNGTFEFWTYDPARAPNSWVQLTDVPAGARSVREGSGAAAVTSGDTTWVYFLKGSGTQEFYRYNTAANTWQSLAGAPLGTSGKTWKNGSGVAYDGDNTIYALKGSYNEFAAYDIVANTWTTKTMLPMIGSSGRKKKVKDGAGIAVANGKVWALKGGNTYEYWCYQADSNRWIQKEDILIGGGKRVKGGGALTSSGDALWALKGNNTFEFYKYVPAAVYANGEVGSTSGEQSAMSDVRLSTFALRTFPNPFSNTTTISYAVPRAGGVTLRLYDIHGRLISILASGYRSAGSYTLGLRPDAAPLVRGIYILKLDTGNSSAQLKLIAE